jgi:hypothetical protein
VALLFNLRWPGFKSLGMVEVTRTANHEVERFTRYFITSLFCERINDFVRAQRRIELGT